MKRDPKHLDQPWGLVKRVGFWVNLRRFIRFPRQVWCLGCRQGILQTTACIPAKSSTIAILYHNVLQLPTFAHNDLR